MEKTQLRELCCYLMAYLPPGNHFVFHTAVSIFCSSSSVWLKEHKIQKYNSDFEGVAAALLVFPGGLEVKLLLQYFILPTVFIPCWGMGPLLFHAPNPGQNQCQTKHGAYMGVTQGQPEKNAGSRGVSRRNGVAVVPRPPSRWPVGNPLTRTEDWRDRGRGEFRLRGQFAAKRKTCLVGFFSAKQ